MRQEFVGRLAEGDATVLRRGPSRWWLIDYRTDFGDATGLARGNSRLCWERQRETPWGQPMASLLSSRSPLGSRQHENTTGLACGIAQQLRFTG